jgi:hypothetical protein
LRPIVKVLLPSSHDHLVKKILRTFLIEHVAWRFNARLRHSFLFVIVRFDRFRALSEGLGEVLILLLGRARPQVKISDT